MERCPKFLNCLGEAREEVSEANPEDTSKKSKRCHEKSLKELLRKEILEKKSLEIILKAISGENPPKKFLEEILERFPRNLLEDVPNFLNLCMYLRTNS